MRILSLVFMLAGAPASADVIRWGDMGSIFGGSSWEVTPDNRVVFSAYGDDAAFAERAEWVWTNKDMRAGKITFLIPDAFARASAIVVAQGDPGVAPAFETDCTDAGSRMLAVEVAGLMYDVSVDNCIAGSSAATGKAKRHYLAVWRVQDALFEGLGLGRVLAP
jgi:hypothetical protein